MQSSAYYSASQLVGLVFGLLVLPAWAMSDESMELSIVSGPGQAAGIHWHGLSFTYRPASEAATWQAHVTGLTDLEGQPLGRVEVQCRAARSPVTEGCSAGQLDWILDEIELEADFAFARLDGRWQIDLAGPDWTLAAVIPFEDITHATVRLVLDGFDLAKVPPSLFEPTGLLVLLGGVSGTIDYAAGQVEAELVLAAGAFDSDEGLLAAEGLDLAAAITLDLGPDDWPFRLELTQFGGELLAGPLYLPGPEEPVRLVLGGRWPAEDRVALEQVHLDDPDALWLTGSANLVLDAEAGWTVAEIDLPEISVELPRAFERWAEGPAAALGFGGLTTRGRADAAVTWQAGASVTAEARLWDVSLDDPAGRLGFEGIAGTAGWNLHGPQMSLDWQALTFYGLQFGASELRLDSSSDGADLLQPLRMPLLDGAFVIERLTWHPELDEQLVLDARIEPLSLAGLTRQLELPEFGGVLSGEFPGIVFADERLSFTGAIDMQAFSGTVRIEDLAIERPFGTLPALSAQMEFSRLDLLEVTGAFNFGRMEGQMSGWARDLRLLDWRPVAMDARIFTHEDARRRRISQRAVDDLANLGGAGGALISGTVLRVFDDFPYRRAGLACRLSNNICHIDGVARHESGGFYIVEGRALPRLDVIGHRRLIDWPQLISQLTAITE